MSDRETADNLRQAASDDRLSINGWALDIVRNDLLEAWPSSDFWINFDDCDMDDRCFWNRCGLGGSTWEGARPGGVVKTASRLMVRSWKRALKLIDDTTVYTPFLELVSSPKATYLRYGYRRYFSGYEPREWMYKLTLNG